MSAPGLTSPIRPEGFDNLQLNAGAFLVNFNISAIKSASALKAAAAAAITAGESLGMTSGGGTFTVKRDTRLPDTDGRRYRHKGAEFVDAMDAYLTSTLVETTPENWRRTIGTTEPFDSNTATKAAYKVRTMLGPDSYLTNITWVGDLADGRMAAIVLQNALNTADIQFTFQDKNEGRQPFELHAHQSAVNVYDTAPVQVVFFDDHPVVEDKTPVALSASFRAGEQPDALYLVFDPWQFGDGTPAPDNVRTFFNFSLASVPIKLDLSITDGGQTTTRTITLPKPQPVPSALTEVPGFMYDVLKGELVITHGFIESYAGEAVGTDWLCSKADPTMDLEPVNGSQVVYRLAEPIVYSGLPALDLGLDGVSSSATVVASFQQHETYTDRYKIQLSRVLDFTLLTTGVMDGPSGRYRESAYTVKTDLMLNAGSYVFGGSALPGKDWSKTDQAYLKLYALQQVGEEIAVDTEETHYSISGEQCTFTLSEWKVATITAVISTDNGRDCETSWAPYLRLANSDTNLLDITGPETWTENGVRWEKKA